MDRLFQRLAGHIGDWHCLDGTTALDHLQHGLFLGAATALVVALVAGLATHVGFTISTSPPFGPRGAGAESFMAYRMRFSMNKEDLIGHASLTMDFEGTHSPSCWWKHARRQSTSDAGECGNPRTRYQFEQCTETCIHGNASGCSSDARRFCCPSFGTRQRYRSAGSRAENPNAVPQEIPRQLAHLRRRVEYPLE